MKKVILLVAVVLFSISIIGISSCDEEKDALSCAKLLTNMNDAYSDYLQTPTTSTCNDYKDALQDLIDDCDDLLQTQIDAYQASIDALDCDNL